MAVVRWLVLSLLLLSAPEATGQVNEPTSHQYGTELAQRIIACRGFGPQTGIGVLLFHGGGWASGNPGALSGVCNTFARNGVAAFSIGYRLADGRPQNRWPAQIDDAAAALGWIRQNAAQFGIDPSKLCTYGESAGAQLAITLAQRDQTIACVVDAFGPVDLTKFGKPFERGFRMLFGPEIRDISSLRAASPLFNPARLPPTLIIHGKQDELVPLEQSMALLSKIKAERGVAALYLYDGGHAWLNLSPAQSRIILGQVASFVRLAGELATTDGANK